MKGFFILCGLLVGLYLFWENSEISRPAGVHRGGACELILVESLSVW